MDQRDYEQSRQAFLRGWEACCRQFGPVLEPAFREDEPARRTLLAAINRIGRRELKEAIGLLQEIRECCQCDADTAAWSFLVGFCFELAGKTENMMHCYRASADCGSRYYMPYLKMAAVEHGNAAFDAARQDYSRAIALLQEMPEEQWDGESLASAYTRLASCLTMMHRYREAEESWKKGRSLSRTPGNTAAGALLYAALGKELPVRMLLEELEEQNRELCTGIRELTAQILDGSHPHFHPIAPDDARLHRFWRWFGEKEGAFSAQEPEAFAQEIGAQLNQIFPFLEREAQLQLLCSGEEKQLILLDSYAIGLQAGYARLLALRPPELGHHWSFSLGHE